MPCKYQEGGVCDCPGGPDFEPKKGVVPQDNGLKCLDHNRLLEYPYSLAHRKLPGGRHVKDAVEGIEKLEEAQKKYRKSEKGKKSRRKYRESEKGQKAAKKHRESPKFKLSRQKYQESQKGQDSLGKQSERKRLWRKAAKWLADNPGKTYDDYIKEVEGGNDKRNLQGGEGSNSPDIPGRGQPGA